MACTWASQTRPQQALPVTEVRLGGWGRRARRLQGDRRPQVEATLLERELGKAERVVRKRAGPQQIRKGHGLPQKQQPCGLKVGQRADALKERVLLGACAFQALVLVDFDARMPEQVLGQ